VIIEGSLFWKGWSFPELVNQYLEKLDVDMNQIKIESIENSSVVGAAQLIL